MYLQTTYISANNSYFNFVYNKKFEETVDVLRREGHTLRTNF